MLIWIAVALALSALALLVWQALDRGMALRRNGRIRPERRSLVRLGFDLQDRIMRRRR